MRYYCYCGKIAFLEQTSALLIRGLFLPMLENKSLFVLCEDCGKDILNKYNDTYGIGV